MKSILLILCFGLVSFSLSAGDKAVNSEDFVAGTVSMSEASHQALTKAELKEARMAEKQALKLEKKQLKAEKRLNWANRVLERKMGKNSFGGVSDPIDRWAWYAIFAGAGALIFTFIWWPISTILWIAALVFLVIWLIKKFG